MMVPPRDSELPTMMPATAMPPSAVYLYWVTHGAVSAILLTVLLAGLFLGGRSLLNAFQRRFPRRKE